jgi:hypothetical protein
MATTTTIDPLAPTKPSVEQIERFYENALAAAKFIKENRQYNLSNAEWIAMVTQNKRYIVSLLEKDWWTTEDLTPLREAVAY